MKNQSKILSGIPLVLYYYTSMLYNSHIPAAPHFLLNDIVNACDIFQHAARGKTLKVIFTTD